jgi:pimeloyl-ACP methyl ester carboxylesterase
MSIKPMYCFKFIGFLCWSGRCQINLKAVFLVLLTIVFLSCEKNKDTGSDPVYGPAVTKQFGAVSANVQELSFRSNGFSIVGDFRTPVSGEVHPVIIMVHGSGGATRHGAVPFEPLIEIFLQNGFAVLSWDKPGSGESKGEFDNEYKLTERANIIADAVKVLIDNPSIDNSSIGLWGISAAGWVMPLALNKTDDIAFMIVVSGGGENGIDQYAYQIAQVVACSGGTVEQVNAVELNWSKMAKATVYNDYREAVEVLVDIPGVVEYTGLSISEENQWNPWPRDIDAFFDPMDVIQYTTIPVLVFFGELDKNIDPVQGAQAYETALKKAGNQDYRISILHGAGHVLAPANTGCLNEFVPAEYVPEYLDILDSWISNQNP